LHCRAAVGTLARGNIRRIWVGTNVGKIIDTRGGFSIVEALVFVLAVLVLAGSGWWAWNQYHRPGAPPGPRPAPGVTAGWDTYESKRGRFSLRYPPGWDISGFRDEIPVTAAGLNGQETQIRLLHSEDGANQFGMDLRLSSSVGSGVYGHGSADRLSNGLVLWTSDRLLDCPDMQLVSAGGRFAARLPNGTALGMYGSFCWGQKSTTSYSYDQQIASTSFRQARQIIESIQVR
jgi:hypothetical protein